MPTQAEFEEKTYESYFCIELANVFENIFLPGHRAEAYLGFDAAFFVPWHDIPWLHIPFWQIRKRIEYGYSLHDLNHILEEQCTRLPKAKFNLYIQFKRPELIVGYRGAEWSFWNEPYYRYQIKVRQQNILSALDANSGCRAAVIYASPAYIESDTLYRYHEQNRIISESNIVPVNRLQNHARYTYIESGNSGIACTEAEEIEGPTFEDIIGEAERSEPLGFLEHLLWTCRMIEECLMDDRTADVLETGRASIVSRLTSDERTIEPNTVLHAIFTIGVFLEISNSRLLFLY